VIILIFTSKLKTVLQVAVKVQYPGVAKSIQSDIRNGAVSKYLFEETKNRRWKFNTNNLILLKLSILEVAAFKLTVVLLFVA
jgi:hypothetical protein